MVVAITGARGFGRGQFVVRPDGAHLSLWAGWVQVTFPLRTPPVPVFRGRDPT
jgi:hypothetical protein